MRSCALIVILVGGGCGFTYGSKVARDSAPFTYKAWGSDSGMAYGNAMEKAQAHRHAFEQPERVSMNCPFYWIKPLVAAPVVGGFAVAATQNNTVLSSGLAVGLVVLLFVPNCRATLGYEHDVPSLSAPFALEPRGPSPNRGPAPGSRGPSP
jgi:hypothetical protein